VDVLLAVGGLSTKGRAFKDRVFGLVVEGGEPGGLFGKELYLVAGEVLVVAFLDVVSGVEAAVGGEVCVRDEVGHFGGLEVLVMWVLVGLNDVLELVLVLVDELVEACLSV